MELEIDQGRPVERASPRDTPADDNAVRKALSLPFAFEDLASFLANRTRLLVVVNDHTRATPTRTVLNHLPLKGKETVTIIATGTHRTPSPEELTKILGGSTPPYGGPIVVHDSKDTSSLRELGRTSRGTDVSLNSHLFEADGIIAIGSVEPHYFAGFTGGRKFLLPALAGFKSVEMNHSLALDERAQVLALEGNPVHEDFMEALRMFNRYEDIFSIQLVLNSSQQTVFASSGHIIDSFSTAVEQAKKTYVPKVEAKADIIIALVKPPLNLDLYQAQKALENVKSALNTDGVLILVSKCSDGIGNRGFYDLLTSPEEMARRATEGYTFGYHKALRIRELLRRAKIFAITDIPPKVLERISVSPFSNVQSALEEATRLKGRNSRVLVVDDAGVTVPLPPEN
jgi:nickel-dependent lactate racemase